MYPNSHKNLYKINVNRPKYLKYFKIEPMILNKYNVKYDFNNRTIDHFEFSFNFCFYVNIWNLPNIVPNAELTTLTYLLKVINIKKLTLNFIIDWKFYWEFKAFCGTLRNFIQQYCNNMYVIVSYNNSHFANNPNIIDKNYRGIEKTRINHHRNFKVKNRLIK